MTLTRVGFGSVPGMTGNQRAIGNALEAIWIGTADPAKVLRDANARANAIVKQ